MEMSRQEAFTKPKLKPPCVELSAVGLRFRGNQATPNDVFRALNSLYIVLVQLADKDALDEKLAEYAFFPLCHIFNETQRTPVNSLEVSVKCLRILVGKGWRRRLSPQMGKQLMILLTLIVGGTPNKSGETQSAQIRSPELSIAGYDCLLVIFNALEGPVATETVYHEIGTATVVDQTVYLLLEGVVDEGSDELCISAAKALQALFQRITDRVVLASIMPRTVSTLTKVIKPTTQIRRSFRLLSTCLQIFNYLVKMVLNDRASKVPEKSAPSPKADDPLVLDGSWLKATSTQIKLALANVIQIRRHDRPEVQAALLELCLMIVEDCQNTLQEALPIIVETVVVLADVDESQTPNEAFMALKHLATTYHVVVDSLKNSLHTWVTAFPRTMQSNDETAKQWAVKQISTAFQILSQVQSGSDILVNNLASGICDSVAVAVNQSTNALQPLGSGISDNQTLAVLHNGSQSSSFPTLILEHRSQQKTLDDLRSMIVKLNASESGNEITRIIINRVHREHGNSLVAPFWLALSFLNSNTQLTSVFDDFISSDELEPSSQNLTRASMIEELYYVSLSIINEPLADELGDWRVQALALEVVALQAQQLGEAFRPELMDALYPVLQLLASSNPSLQKHAMTCLNILTTACNYGDASTMIIENVDYLVNSVALKLNTFDVSPYPPQVLLMMVKLCGVRLVPYLDDLVDSIFSILDMYHGYPRLVEMMFRTLASIVEEGTKSPSFLAIGDGTENAGVNHRKKQYEKLQMSTLAKDLAYRRAKRAELAEEIGEADEMISHPKKPWTREPEKAEQQDPDIDPNPDTFSELLKEQESDEPLPPPREPEDSEKPLTKSHTLLLHIVKSIPSHMSSPSPYLRRSLLSILIDVFPTLSPHENSFLPLINDLWPSVASRISFPTSFSDPTSSTTSSTSTTLIPTHAPTPPEIASTRLKKNASEFDFQEEIFVSTTACKAIETICKSAGDFMASRVETEFPRWERLYIRAWEKVRQDTDKVIERRANHKQPSTSTSAEQPSNPDTDPDTSLSLPFTSTFTQSLSLTTTGSHGTRSFTPHHTLWRAMVPLFVTLLAHVRLPLSMGDRICEFLGAWIVRYAGPEYYSSRSQVQKDHPTPESGLPSLRVEIESVESVIQVMETWNADLTWFIFQEQRAQVVSLLSLARRKRTTATTRMSSVSKIVDLDEEPLKAWSVPGTRLRFAEMVF
ncbi:HEAT repeat protein [Aspergillus heteromorphus CBS 117.55]|uniref:HEAT repeat protein n=1 Tax=Aspergillus heteromorphus CBS 117.55 TaxID=1448321 RepID=A0A317V6P7_9EURO|nr:HEAT repeat protein [Aspergillus heteromorphus CBS 117.55]PWY68627.1 HEAT repeat protein [Aspergillus heteromorphus CBS 117.55]